MSYVLDARDEDHLSAEPFRDATVKVQAQPHYPDMLQATAEASTSVDVAIEPDGTLQDAWIWGPSGVTPFDDEAVHAARMSTYVGARSYCKAVPGTYFFRVTFDPNS